MRFLCLVASLCAFACAKGSGGRPDGSPRTLDSGPIDATGFDTRIDTRPPGNDGGTGCEDDGHPMSCDVATDLGTIDIGGMMMVSGTLPTLSDEDWFTVTFPPMNMPNSFGGGMPQVELSGDATMVFEVRTSCMASFSCGEGIPRELTSFTFVDDQSMAVDPPGEVPNDYSTRDRPWPEILKIRVGRRGGPATCDTYTLTISR